MIYYKGSSIVKMYQNGILVSKAYRNGQLVFNGLHAKTQAVISYAISNGIPVPPDISYLDNYIKAAESVLNRLDLHYCFVGPGTPAFKLINICNPGTYNGIGYGGLGWSNSGVAGNGANAYIDTNFNPSLLVAGQKYRLNDASILSCVQSAITGYIVGTEFVGPKWLMMNSETNAQRINNGAGDTLINFLGTGLKALSRSSSSSFVAINKNVQAAVSSVSTSLDNNTFLIARQTATYWSGALNTFGVGASLSFSETQLLRAATNSQLATLGLAQIA